MMQDNSQDIYFIGIIPPGLICEEIRAIKERIRDRFGASHALKSPAHITLQMPFKRRSAEEVMISTALRRFAMAERGFMVITDGYGAFPPRVIYIKITDPEPIRSLHRRFREMLISELGFTQDDTMKDIKPHITVATRDLARSAFIEAWPEYSDEKFNVEFWVGSISLLKHNGRNWDIYEEYPFGEQ